MPHRPPNIVLMIAHDLGAHIGPYGRAVEQCPNLNRFAAESVRQDGHFVTSPGCSQSRSSLVTGRYPHNNGQFGLAHLGWDLHRDELILPGLLREHGYHTGLIGIWHLHAWTLSAFDSVNPDVSTADTSPEAFAEVASTRAAKWLRARPGAGKPFYLHVGFWETHRPFCGQEADGDDPPAELDLDAVVVPEYLPDNEPTRREVAHLHLSVKLVDDAAGRILAAIDDAGLRDETLVIFTVDHGLPFPRAKGTLYDPGIQVAYLARWPGVIPPASHAEALTSNLDVMPTLLEAGGAPCPDRVQGRSFLPLLRGETKAHRDAVFSEKTYHEHYDPMRAVRTARYKYIRSFADRPRLVLPSDIYNSTTRQSMKQDEMFWSHRSREELYDVRADPRELDNLANAPRHAEALNEMRQRLDAWMRDTEDPLLHGPIPRPQSTA